MLDGDPRRLRLAFSLLFSWPGTPVIAYGDELGMGDDLSRPERESVRTAMQWSDAPNAGFSPAPPDPLTMPVIDEGRYSFRRINAAAQRDDPDSLLSWVRRAIAVRRRCPELARGSWTTIATGDPAVLAHQVTWDGMATVAAHNLGPAPRCVTLAGENLPASPSEVFANQEYPALAPNLTDIKLAPYGCRWFRSTTPL